MSHLRRLHRWLGLVAALPFLLVALSGALLVWRAQLEPLLVAPLLATPPCATPLPLDRLVDAARAANPDAGALKLVRLYGDPARSARVRFGDGRWIFVDRCSARVLGAQALYTGPVGSVSWLHIFGFTGNSETMMKVAGLAFAALVAAGLALWRPNRRPATRAGRGMRWHRGAGVCAALVLLTSIGSGLMQAFGWGAVSPLAPAAPASSTAASAWPLAQLLAKADALAPQAARIQIRLPAAPGDPVRFEMVARDAAHANAVEYASFDPATGALLAHVPYASNTAAHRLYLLAAGLHYGWIGGLPVQLLLCGAALAVGVLAWTGTAAWLRTRGRERALRRQSARLRLRLRVARRTVEANGICSFELVPARGRRLPRFAAGAHIDLYIAPGLVRQYSLCNHPGERHRYLICVLEAQRSRGGSRALHAQFQAGDLIETGLPRNLFPLAPAAQRSILFAGGIGITPILSMAEQLASKGADFELHYYARSRAHAAFAGRLAQSAFAHRVHLHLSDAPPGERCPPAALLSGPQRDTHVYVCGPAGFMEAVLDAARGAGWQEAQLHREVFAGAAPQAENAPFTLRLASSGRTIAVGRDESALDALLGAGFHIPHSCRQGLCGSCLTGVVDGLPEHRDHCLSPEEQARNDLFAPCCSRAQGCLTLEL